MQFPFPREFFAPPRQRRKLRVETLESRAMLAVTSVAVSGVQQVRVNGTSVAGGVAAASVTSVVINAGGGNDKVDLSKLSAANFRSLTSGAVQVYGGTGSDTLLGSGVGDLLDGGHDRLEGNGGNEKEKRSGLIDSTSGISKEERGQDLFQ